MGWEAIIDCTECPPGHCGAELGPYDTAKEARAAAEEWMDGYSMFYLRAVKPSQGTNL